MIRLEHISYWYPNNQEPALCDLSIEINDSESVCVMGRNGSGKSTLIKLIAGLIQPERGRVEIDGGGADDSSPGGTPRPGEVGILFQNPDNQMVATQVEKEIAFALENRSVPLAEMTSAVARLAQQFRIEHLLGRLTSELSGGEKQRVALASVMIQKPAILLLDEPDSFLDQIGRSLLTAELDRIHSENSHLIELRITQSTEIAQKYGRVIILDRGTVIADGPPLEILADRELCTRTGLTVPDTSQVTLSVPASLRTNATDARLAEISLKAVDFAWPMSAPVFEKLSLSLQAGETVGLVGPTGVGKSSLGLLISGLVSPVQGEVSFLSRDGDHLLPDSVRGQVVLVLQQPERQFFLDSCAREVAFGPSNLGRTLPKGEIDTFFEMVGLNPARYAERDPFSLSAGEKRRLAFAAVLSMAPSMVVFDEPTAGLDGEGIGRFICLSRTLRDAGLGQMIISHDGDVIGRLVDRVLYLTDRKEMIELRPAELLSHPGYAGVISRSSSPG